MPDEAAGALYEKFLAAKHRLMQRAGVDPEWGRHAPAAMHAAGLVDIDTQIHVQTYRADTPTARLLAHTTHHLRESYLSAGLTTSDRTAIRALLTHPTFQATTHPLHTTQPATPDPGAGQG